MDCDSQLAARFIETTRTWLR